MGNVIKINDGFKTYDIVNQDNKLLGQFSFNPSDTNIIKRYNDAIEQFEKVFDEFKGMEEIPLLPSKIEGTICVKPTEAYEGFFVAKIRKIK